MVACGGPSWGWIMPAPLAAPKMRTSRPAPSTSMTALLIFILVSVVMMARANSSACSEVLPNDAFTAGRAATTFSAGKGTPMMPVEEGKTVSGVQLKLSAAATQVAMQASMPAAPVAQLALPALTRTVETRPPVAAMCLRPTVTGAATSWLVVNIAAAVAPLGANATARSNFPLGLMPALTAPHSKPKGSAVEDSLVTVFIIFHFSKEVRRGYRTTQRRQPLVR